jgi:SHS2 domain-containing protein
VPFEIVEHTADVGVRATAPTIESLFEETTRGLLEITGSLLPGAGEWVEFDVESRDLAGALVDWLGEALYLQDSRDAVVTDIRVDAVNGGRARGALSLAPRHDADLEGTAVKAITYHQLRVEETAEGWTAQVFVDV